MHIDDQIKMLMHGTEFGDEKLKQAMADELRERLITAEKEDRPLRIYCGFDPTSSDLHLGHTVPIRKMKQFQALGHHVMFVVGNYTALVGDPSDKDKLRPVLTEEQVSENARTYAQQAFKILDQEKTEIVYNGTWLSELSFKELIELSSNFTIQQFLTRENFRGRWDKGDPIYLHETFYAVMQGYDAYMLDTDVQIGGADQLFNIITAGRKLMTSMGKAPNTCILMGILPGTDGEIRMSKSMGNHIPIMAEPNDMYGKVMSVPDKAMTVYYRLLTRFSPSEIDELEKMVSEGKLHPRDAKMKLAREIVSIYHNDEAAIKAEKAFVKVFQQQAIPEEINEFAIAQGEILLDVLVNSKLVSSRTNGRRMVKQNAVRLDGDILHDPFMSINNPGILQVGKRKFIRVIFA